MRLRPRMASPHAGEIDVVADLRMPFRAAMPVERDEADHRATESGCPAHHRAATEPISASGTEPMMMRAKSVER